MTSEEPVAGSDATSLFIGAVVALATIAIGIGLVFVASTGASRNGSAAGPEMGETATTSSTASTTTTSSTTTTTTTAPFGGDTPNTSPSNSGGSGGAVQPGRAYSDPEDDPYEPVPLPAGISATLATCNWEAVNGGELQATGTISADPQTDDVWFIDVYWLQNDRELDSQTEVIELDPGASLPWRLTIAAELPPADPFRCALEIS